MPYPDQFTPWKPDKAVAMTVTFQEMSDLGILKSNGAATMAQLQVFTRPVVNQVLTIINGGSKDVPRNH